MKPEREVAVLGTDVRTCKGQEVGGEISVPAPHLWSKDQDSKPHLLPRTPSPI